MCVVRLKLARRAVATPRFEDGNLRRQQFQNEQTLVYNNLLLFRDFKNIWSKVPKIGFFIKSCRNDISRLFFDLTIYSFSSPFILGTSKNSFFKNIFAAARF